MSNITLDFHPVGLFIFTEKNKEEVILSGYDGGYKGGRGEVGFVRSFIHRSKPNLLGGHPTFTEKIQGPYESLVREIAEEICKGDKDVDWKGRPLIWADEKDIHYIQEQVIKGLQPFADFLVETKEFDSPKKRIEIFTIYLSIIREEVFKLIRNIIRSGRRFYAEGFIGIHCLRQLEAAGEFSTAHATAPILNSYFRTTIPYPEEIHFSKIGNVRKKYSDYDLDFIHSEQVWSKK